MHCTDCTWSYPRWAYSARLVSWLTCRSAASGLLITCNLHHDAAWRAAEEGSPDEVWEAIKLLKCARLDHGVRAMEDPACIAFLEETQVPLTVCPRSNYMVRPLL